jgi:hypothetical protein
MAVVKQLHRHQYLSWSYEDVAAWMESIGYPQYKECMISNLINGRKLIWLDSSSLPSIGIHDWLHIKEITRQVRELLQLEEPYWNKSISLPHRCNKGIFLERKSQTGRYGDELTFNGDVNNN